MDLNTSWEFFGYLGIVYFLIIYFAIGISIGQNKIEKEMDFYSHMQNLLIVPAWPLFAIRRGFHRLLGIRKPF